MNIVTMLYAIKIGVGKNPTTVSSHFLSLFVPSQYNNHLD